MTTETQAEHDNQQPIGDDTCGERCVAMALELRGAFAGPGPGKAFVDAAWQAVVDADAPGTPESQRGTGLDEERRVIEFGGQQFRLATTPTPVSIREQLVAACRLGLFVVVGVRLGDLLPNMTSNHYVMAYSTDGTRVTVVDPAHDIDGAYFFSHDVYSLDQVVRGGYDLFGEGQPFGWAFNYTKLQAQEIPMDDATQTAMIDMEARQNGLLTNALKAIRTGQFTDLDTIYCALKGGIGAPDYTPSYPPNS